MEIKWPGMKTTSCLLNDRTVAAVQVSSDVRKKDLKRKQSTQQRAD